jgi:hypothetical protein
MVRLVFYGFIAREGGVMTKSGTGTTFRWLADGVISRSLRNSLA